MNPITDEKRVFNENSRLRILGGRNASENTPLHASNFLQLGAGITAAVPLVLSSACGDAETHRTFISPPPPRSDAKLAIVSGKTYDSQEVLTSFDQAFTLLEGLPALVTGKTVTVKINLTSDGTYNHLFGRPAGESYITHGATAIALASWLLSHGAQKVHFVDSAPFLLPHDQVLISAGWDVPTLLALGHVELENTRNLGSGSQYAKLEDGLRAVSIRRCAKLRHRQGPFVAVLMDSPDARGSLRLLAWYLCH